MQQVYNSAIRDEVWTKMKQIFLKYTNGQPTINSNQLQRVVKQVLKQQSQTELAYVLNNLCKIDTDSSGSIDFQQFASFLLKRHCGEIALQRMHYNNRMSHGRDRKITPEEFVVLLNSAYSFLGISINESQANGLFRQADSDRDGLMTYVEYFTFIDQYLCRPLILTRPTPPPKLELTPSKIQINSRLRRFIWTELKLLYERYDRNRSGGLDVQQITHIMRDLNVTKEQIDYILFKVLRISGSREVSFNEFASFFLKYMMEVALARFYRNNGGGGQQRRLSREEFMKVLEMGLGFLQFGRISTSLLHRFFEKIDSDRDRWITNKESMTWVEVFLCPVLCFGTDYYLQEDDQSLSIGKGIISQGTSVTSTRIHQPSTTIQTSTLQVSSTPLTSRTATSPSIIRVTSPSPISTTLPFKFSSNELAIKVRQRVLSLISQYDINKNLLLQQPQIIHLLQSLLHQSPNQIRYVISNVLRYDKDNDKKITYDELADFLLEMHSGEMAIQRLHMKNVYKRGRDRVMDEGEFVKTIQYAIGFYEVQGEERVLGRLFSEVDGNRDGWISYQEYFEFLRYYFGSQSEAKRVKSDYRVGRTERRGENYVQIKQERYEDRSNSRRYEVPKSRETTFMRQANAILHSSSSFQSKLRLLFRLQTSHHLFPANPSQPRPLTLSHLLPILSTLFHYNDSVLRSLLSPLFPNPSSTISFQSLFNWLSSVHLDYCIPNFLSKNRLRRQTEELLGFEEFVRLTEFAFGIGQGVMKRQDMEEVFEEMCDEDGWMSFEDWLGYIRSVFKSTTRVLTERNANSPTPNSLLLRTKLISSSLSTSPTPTSFHSQLWSELHHLYNSYDKSHSNRLNNPNLELFCRQALLESSQSELNYIKVSLLRTSPTKTTNSYMEETVTFEQFAPFILTYAAETALKRFHLQQAQGKEHLEKNQFVIIVRSALNFLRTVTERTQALYEIFQSMDRKGNGRLPYVEFLNWIHNQVAKTGR